MGQSDQSDPTQPPALCQPSVNKKFNLAAFDARHTCSGCAENVLLKLTPDLLCSTKEKTTSDGIVVEMKSDVKSEEAIHLKAVNGDKPQ